MPYTYAWASPGEFTLIRTNDSGVQTSIPADPANGDYTEYLNLVEAGKVEEAAPYIIPPPLFLTPEEKLAASGLTVEELKTLLNLN